MITQIHTDIYRTLAVELSLLTPFVIASDSEAILNGVTREDCFAALAMTYR